MSVHNPTDHGENAQRDELEAALSACFEASPLLLATPLDKRPAVADALAATAMRTIRFYEEFPVGDKGEQQNESK